MYVFQKRGLSNGLYVGITRVTFKTPQTPGRMPEQFNQNLRGQETQASVVLEFLQVIAIRSHVWKPLFWGLSASSASLQGSALGILPSSVGSVFARPASSFF